MMDGPANIKKTEEKMRTIWDALEQFPNRSFEQTFLYAKALFDFCPIKVGDQAVMVHPPVITEENASGWMGAKHMFIVGSLVKVRHIDWYDGSFRLQCTFVNETWIPSVGPDKGKQVPVPYRALYNLKAEWLEKVTSDT